MTTFMFSIVWSLAQPQGHKGNRELGPKPHEWPWAFETVALPKDCRLTPARWQGAQQGK